jgi:antitoxin ParD1/3/4
MRRKISISLGEHFETFIDNVVSTGRYKNASEAIEAGLRLLEREERNTTALQLAITEGLDSGMVKNFDPREHLSKLKALRNREDR